MTAFTSIFYFVFSKNLVNAAEKFMSKFKWFIPIQPTHTGWLILRLYQ